ncbi:zinc finger CCHC domain-containing protein 8-like [Anneissia japonica]|uniref:zinc finger CCHC domain-containing protein 8-like n=1 Tax=Anneissia japonica TaxID=1529436 RepID=UPI001425782E|nr:zinc finger CCHC domain-containing protein 8-like [Anneissia japonica]
MPPIQPKDRIEAFTKRLPKSADRKHTSKRRKNFTDDDTTEEIKKRRIENRLDESMDTSVSDSDTERTSTKAGESPLHDENFKPPLPLTPGYRTPPPLPTSTPPPTPGRTPQSGPCSPQIQDGNTPVMSRTPSCGSLDSDANNIGTFSPCSAANSQEGSRTESPTLDDLEQQRLNLLSAFEDGDTEGTSDTGEMITVNGELFTVTDCENGSNEVQSANQDEDSQSGDGDSTNKTKGYHEDSSEEVQVPLKDPGYSSERTENEGYESGELEEKTEDKTEGTTKFLVKDDLTPNKSGVPHWSKFSKDISPHPPNENLMESKGVFKRICSILKKTIKKDS